MIILFVDGDDIPFVAYLGRADGVACDTDPMAQILIRLRISLADAAPLDDWTVRVARRVMLRVLTVLVVTV